MKFFKHCFGCMVSGASASFKASAWGVSQSMTDKKFLQP